MRDVVPVRLRLSRRAGFRLQLHSRAVNGLPAVKVDRTTPYGNPYQAGADGSGGPAYLVGLYRAYLARDEQAALRARIVVELAGHNLACWCSAGAPCHADVLLELANAGRTVGAPTDPHPGAARPPSPAPTSGVPDVGECQRPNRLGPVRRGRGEQAET